VYKRQPMILIDTNVLVALVDERDSLRARALTDLGKLRGPYGILDAVLVETYFLLGDRYLRERVRFTLTRLAVRHVSMQPDGWNGVFDWLEKYAGHEPDLCDAMLAVTAGRDNLTLWTYDREFQQLWRTPDGQKLKLVGTAPKTSRRKTTRT
jgi:predicted nucleic acid-binding protein